MTLPDLNDSERIALFLDFDGTLVAIADRPDEVQLDLSTRKALMHLDTLLGGAVAIITGARSQRRSVSRSAAPVDRRRPWLDAAGRTRTHPYADRRRRVCVCDRASCGRSWRSTLLYSWNTNSARSRCTIGSHPELEQDCIALMEAAVAELPGVELKRGKMVVEAKAVGGNKGAAIADYLNEEPFAGRRAVFAGDDIDRRRCFRSRQRPGRRFDQSRPGQDQCDVPSGRDR